MGKKIVIWIQKSKIYQIYLLILTFLTIPGSVWAQDIVEILLYTAKLSGKVFAKVGVVILKIEAFFLGG